MFKVTRLVTFVQAKAGRIVVELLCETLRLASFLVDMNFSLFESRLRFTIPSEFGKCS